MEEKYVESCAPAKFKSCFAPRDYDLTSVTWAAAGWHSRSFFCSSLVDLDDLTHAELVAARYWSQPQEEVLY